MENLSSKEKDKEIEELRKENEYLRSYIYPKLVGKFLFIPEKYKISEFDQTDKVIYGFFRITYNAERSYYIIGGHYGINGTTKTRGIVIIHGHVDRGLILDNLKSGKFKIFDEMDSDFKLFFSVLEHDYFKELTKEWEVE